MCQGFPSVVGLSLLSKRCGEFVLSILDFSRYPVSAVFVVIFFRMFIYMPLCNAVCTSDKY